MIRAGIQSRRVSSEKAITKEKMARPCRRRTRGVEKTVELIECLILSLFSATDTLGAPLLKERRTIWAEQKTHVACIQDPPDIQLYTVTGHITKSGVQLCVLRCARGSNSLESFHLHIARFIPGTSAIAVNFQAYLLEGLTRWNADRASSAVQSPAEPPYRTSESRLQSGVQELSVPSTAKTSSTSTNHLPSTPVSSLG